MIRLEPVNGPPCSCGRRDADWDVRINSRGVFLCRPCAAELKAALPEPVDHAAEVERAIWDVHNIAQVLKYPSAGLDRREVAGDLQHALERAIEHLEAL